MEMTPPAAPTAALPFDLATVPQHVAIIMDGNGRWAAARGLPRLAGHEAGARTLRTIMQACGDWHIKYLTVYAFSTENWKRPAAEVDGLMTLLEQYLRGEAENLRRDNIGLRVIGDRGRLPAKTRESLENTLATLRACDGHILTLALNYGGRDEIVRAARQLAAQATAGVLRPEDIDEPRFAACLDSAGTPDPDLLIRTAGEKRLSNFLPWQLSYAELYVTTACWPDFNRDEFARALAEYQRRTRKFGGLV